MNFKLEPGDIIVNVNSRNDPFSKVKRWLAGPHEHVFVYLGAIDFAPLDKPPLRVPMLFESYGRGVCLRSLSERYGQEVVVMRLKAEADKKRIPRVLEEAIKLASDERSYYDYYAILKFAIPRLICEKLGLPLPLAWHRDEFQICSEACWEVFHQAGINLLPDDIIPLPGDFVESNLLIRAWQGQLTFDLL